MPPRQQARATESLYESVCVEVRDRVWALMRGAGREEHPAVRWSSGPVSVVEAERDTTYVFPEKGTGGTLMVVFMRSLLKRFLRTLVGEEGLRDDAMDYMRQHIPRRPPVNCREAQAAVETVGFIPIAMEHIVPPVPNAMFIDRVRAPPEDGVLVIRARDAVDVDALSDGPVPVVLSEELREFHLIDSALSRGGALAMHPPPPQDNRPICCVHPCYCCSQMSGLCRALLSPPLSFQGLYYRFLTLRALHSPACHHCPICTPILSFSVAFLLLGLDRLRRIVEGGGTATPPPPQTAQFDVYTPIIAVPQVCGLCTAQLCLTVSFEGLYCWLWSLWALQGLACHLICIPIRSFVVPFLGLGQS